MSIDYHQCCFYFTYGFDCKAIRSYRVEIQAHTTQ